MRHMNTYNPIRNCFFLGREASEKNAEQQKSKSAIFPGRIKPSGTFRELTKFLPHRVGRMATEHRAQTRLSNSSFRLKLARRAEKLPPRTRRRISVAVDAASNFPPTGTNRWSPSLARELRENTAPMDIPFPLTENLVLLELSASILPTNHSLDVQAVSKVTRRERNS